MSVSVEEVLNNAGYDIQNNVDDAEWLLCQQSEWDILIMKAEELSMEYEDYLDYVEDMEEDGDLDKIESFEEWRKNKQK